MTDILEFSSPLLPHPYYFAVISSCFKKMLVRKNLEEMKWSPPKWIWKWICHRKIVWPVQVVPYTCIYILTVASWGPRKHFFLLPFFSSPPKLKDIAVKCWLSSYWKTIWTLSLQWMKFYRIMKLQIFLWSWCISHFIGLSLFTSINDNHPILLLFSCFSQHEQQTHDI